MGDGVGRVDIGGDAGMGDKVCRGVFLSALAPVQDCGDTDPAPAGRDEGLGDRLAGKGVGLEKDLAGGGIDLPDNGLGRAAIG